MKLEITVGELRKYSILVGVPMYGGSCMGAFAKSTVNLAQLCTHYGIKIDFLYLFNESLIQRARNYITDEFMRSDYTHLMFIDADVCFDAHDVLSLLGMQISNPEKYNVISAPYPMKTIAWEKVQKAVLNGVEKPTDLANYTADYVFNMLKGTTKFNIGDPLEVSETGTGFMLIPRETFDKYKENYPELSYRPDHLRSENFNGENEIMAYFDCTIDPDTRRYLSEDYFFCQNVRKMGYSIYTCPWMKLDHIGMYRYKGDMESIASLGQTPVRKPKTITKTNRKNKLGTRP